MQYRAKISLLFICLLVLASILAACGEAPAPPTSATIGATAAPTLTSIVIPTAASTINVAPTLPAPGNLAKSGGSLVTGVTGDAKTIHPYKRGLYIEYVYSNLLYSARLTRRTPQTLAVIGNAAASWKVEQSTVIFTLKDGIYWSDGKPITAEDYLWTWQQAIKKENNWPAAQELVYDPANPVASAIESYEALDAKTLKIKLHGVVFNLVEAADQIEPLPRHVWQDKDWNDPTRNSEIEKPSVVSGPWQLKEWAHDKYFTLIPNPKSTIYPVPYLTELNFLILPNSTIGFQKLKIGELDFYQPAEQDFPELEKLPQLNAYKMQQAAASFDYIGINFRQPYLQDINFRQALNYALDKKLMLDTIVFNLGEPVYSSVVPASLYYNDKIEKYNYDLPKAKKLLSDAGYTIKDGKLHDPKGQPIPKLKFRHNLPNISRANTAAFVQQAWKELGLDLEIITSDLPTMNKILAAPPFDYDFWIANWSTGINAEEFGGIWKKIPQFNRGNWVNQEVNQLYTEVVKELDFEKRKSLMFKIQEIEARELPYIFYYARLDYIAINKRVGGVTPGPLGADINLYTDWYIIK